MTEEIYSYISLGTGIAAIVMLALAVALFFVLKIPRVISDLSGRTARRAIEDIRRQNEASGDKSHRSSYVNMHRSKLTDKISPSRRIQHPTSGASGKTAGTTKIPTQGLRGKTGKTKGNTGKMPGVSGRMPGTSGQMPVRQEYAPRHVFQGEQTTILPDMNATTVLPENNVTTVLPEYNVTTVLPENNVTTVLPENNVTTVLPENNAAAVFSEKEAEAIFGQEAPAAQNAAPAPQETAVLSQTNETTVLYAGNETSVLYNPRNQAAINPVAVFDVVKEITFIHTNEMIPAEGIYGR
jgi:hypothetical protein